MADEEVSTGMAASPSNRNAPALAATPIDPTGDALLPITTRGSVDREEPICRLGDGDRMPGRSTPAHEERWSCSMGGVLVPNG
jgi:hypothetical protein